MPHENQLKLNEWNEYGFYCNKISFIYTIINIFSFHRNVEISFAGKFYYMAVMRLIERLLYLLLAKLQYKTAKRTTEFKSSDIK